MTRLLKLTAAVVAFVPLALAQYDPPMTDADLLEIAHEDLHNWEVCLSGNLQLCGANWGRDIEFRLPLPDSPLSYDAGKVLLSEDHFGELKATRMWLQKVYVGVESVAYEVIAAYLCNNDELSTNRVLFSLKLDPQTREVSSLDQAMFIDDFHSFIARCYGAPPQPRIPQTVYKPEMQAVASWDKIWNFIPSEQQLEPDFDVLDDDIEFCAHFLPGPCVQGKDAVIEMFGPFLNSGSRTLFHDKVFSPGQAWVSWVDVLHCPDGSMQTHNGELIYYIDRNTGKTTRVVDIMNHTDFEKGYCATVQSAGFLPDLGRLTSAFNQAALEALRAAELTGASMDRSRVLGEKDAGAALRGANNISIVSAIVGCSVVVIAAAVAVAAQFFRHHHSSSEGDSEEGRNVKCDNQPLRASQVMVA